MPPCPSPLSYKKRVGHTHVPDRKHTGHHKRGMLVLQHIGQLYNDLDLKSFQETPSCSEVVLAAVNIMVPHGLANV